MSIQILSVSGSNQQLLSYLELCICHVLRLRAVLPENFFINENYLGITVWRVSDSFDKNYLEGVTTVLRGWIRLKQVHCLELILYESLSEKLVEKWVFSLDYKDQQIAVKASEDSISAAFKEIEIQIQLCMLPMAAPLSYDILFKVNEGANLEPTLEPALSRDVSSSQLTEVPLGNIQTGSHSLRQSCFTKMDVNTSNSSST